MQWHVYLQNKGYFIIPQIIVHSVPNSPPINEVRKYFGRASHQVPCLDSAFWH